MKEMLQKILSVKNSKDKKHKVITILGIKIKTKRHCLQMPLEQQETENNFDKQWLLKNAMERMDANRDDFFDRTRCDFHLDRYRFACEFTEGKKVIDCASGTGYGANVIKNLGRADSVVGVEIDNAAVEYATKNYSNDDIKFINGSILDLPFEDNTFDIFTSFETLEHIEDEQKQFCEVKRVLKKGGLYILSTPNDWKTDSINPHHVRKYTYEKLKKILPEHFEIIKIYNQNSGTPNRIENNNQARSIYLTTDKNHNLAECFIVVCKNNKT